MPAAKSEHDSDWPGSGMDKIISARRPEEAAIMIGSVTVTTWNGAGAIAWSRRGMLSLGMRPRSGKCPVPMFPSVSSPTIDDLAVRGVDEITSECVWRDKRAKGQPAQIQVGAWAGARAESSKD